MLKIKTMQNDIEGTEDSSKVIDVLSLITPELLRDVLLCNWVFVN